MALAKSKKSKIFKDRLFSNIIKTKLFIVDNQCYIPLDLSKIAGNVYLFKLNGILVVENLTLKKNWIWDVLEIDWTNVHVSLNDKEINLPITIVIPIFCKLKVRKLLRNRRRDSLHLCIMLKQSKSWFYLENTEHD